MTGDDVFHTTPDDWNLDLEFVLQDWEDVGSAAESGPPQCVRTEHEDASTAECGPPVCADALDEPAPDLTAVERPEAGADMDIAADQDLAFGAPLNLHPDVGWHEFDLESVFQEIVDQTTAESVDQDSGQFDLLKGEEEDLILIDDCGLMQEPEPGEGLPGDSGNTWAAIDDHDQDFAVSEGQDPDWAPVDDPHGLEEDVEDAPDDAGGYEIDEQADYSGYEEGYCEEVGQAGPVTATRHAWWRRAAGVAAAVIVLGLSSLYLKAPASEVVEVEPRLASVVTVERPAIDLDLKRPAPAAQEPGVEAPASPEAAPAPDTSPVVATSEDAEPRRAVVQPERGGLAPAAVEAVPVEEARPTGLPAAEVEESPLADSLPNHGVMERHRETVVQSENGLVMGSQAIARLFNDNVVVGIVKALNSSFVTLRVKTGEVTLQRESIESLTTLAASEAVRARRGSRPGSVRLRNRNRLRGQVVETREDTVILQVDSNRVVVPIAEVQEVTHGRARRPVQVSEAIRIESEPWFKRLVEEGMGAGEAAAHQAPQATRARPEK